MFRHSSTSVRLRDVSARTRHTKNIYSPGTIFETDDSLNCGGSRDPKIRRAGVRSKGQGHPLMMVPHLRSNDEGSCGAGLRGFESHPPHFTHTCEKYAIEYALWLKKEGYRESTIGRYAKIICTLSKRANIIDGESVKRIIADSVRARIVERYPGRLKATRG